MISNRQAAHVGSRCSESRQLGFDRGHVRDTMCTSTRLIIVCILASLLRIRENDHKTFPKEARPPHPRARRKGPGNIPTCGELEVTRVVARGASRWTYARCVSSPLHTRLTVVGPRMGGSTCGRGPLPHSSWTSGCELFRQAPELLTMRPQRMKTHPQEGSQALDVLLLTPELLFHSPSARG